jgi:ABC-2 type transport system permease protein
LAFGALGLVQAAIWVGVGLLSLLLVGPYLNVPVWPLLALLMAYLPWGKLLVFTVFFILGYLFISSFSAAMGATMSDVFSGQQLQSMIVVLPAVLPLSLINLIINNPANAFFQALSFFPPSIPGAMMLRMSLADVPAWEVAASLAVLALSTLGMIRLAGKIFEVGILMYGKSASLREIWRWVRG